MANQAYACRVTRANMNAIASEYPKFDKDEFEKWLHDHHEDGYFVRDEASPAFDCRYMSDIVFSQMYIFEAGDINVLFRRIIEIK